MSLSITLQGNSISIHPTHVALISRILMKFGILIGFRELLENTKYFLPIGALVLDLQGSKIKKFFVSGSPFKNTNSHITSLQIKSQSSYIAHFKAIFIPFPTITIV